MQRFQDLVQDARYALRSLLRAHAFSSAAILSLTLGIGACVAVFTVVNGVMLRPLPFPEPDRLFLISHSPHTRFFTQPSLSDRDYLTFRASDRVFAHLATFSTYKANVLTPAEPLVMVVGRVTAEFFATMAVAPAMGRAFVPGDESNADQLIVLAHDLWRTRLGGDPAIVGKRITVDGRPRTVIAVMPAAFSFPEHAQAWTLYAVRFDPHLTMMSPVVGRLKAEATRRDAEAEFAAIAAHFERQPDSDRVAWRNGILPLKELSIGDVRRPLQVFAASVVIVLLIGCANFANLLLARASGRQREIAIRRALGAGRGRLVRQLLTESTLISVAGGLVGLLAAAWAVPALLALAPEGRIPRVDAIHIDGGVFAFAMALSVATGLLFGLVPAFHLTRRESHATGTPRAQALARDQRRMPGAFVVAQIALALVLLTGAGLLIQTFLRLRAVDPGFQPQNVVALTVELPPTTFGTVDSIREFDRALLDRVAHVSGVSRAGAVNWQPLGDFIINGGIEIPNVRLPRNFLPDKPVVTPGYFATLGIPLLRGRDFSSGDTARSARVAIVSDSVARMIAPAGDAIGRRFAMESPPSPDDWVTVVGVVADIRQSGPRAAPHAAVYRPYTQVAEPFFLSRMTFVARVSSDPLAIAPRLREALRAVDRNQPAQSIVTMTSLVEAATAEQAFNARLLGAFAIVALMLAVLGVYGVLAYSVAQRTREIGLRMALGASPRAVLSSVLASGLTMTVLGVAIGLTGALIASRALATMLYGVEPHDPVTYGGTVAVMIAVGLAASYLPARRAMRLDPIEALKDD